MDIYKILETIQKFAGEPEQKAGSQWKGTDAGTPGTKLVGECDAPMTLADKLRARWEQTKQEKGLQEYGMTTGGTAMQGGGAGAQTEPNPAELAKQTATAQQNINKLKSAGANIPSVGQAVKSVLKDPATDPATPQDKQIAAGLGQEIEQLVTKGDPSSVNQLAAMMKKVKQGGAQ
ncbi:hypothetical protein UFOVP112_457 [uncultured Caudovirales phage]|uniref:Uncharacterized protein n=1 Tax=uncultured Caudovirales phage TaxID=2100421 RepID=A0A6J5LCD9_9CAUD|nr:hypothetical protein UFOVP112_457 [uncultured Caudovirales phage]